MEIVDAAALFLCLFLGGSMTLNPWGKYIIQDLLNLPDYKTLSLKSTLIKTILPYYFFLLTIFASCFYFAPFAKLKSWETSLPNF